MRYPKLVHSLELFKELAPDACKVVIDIGVQHRTPFLMQAFPYSFHHLFEPVSLYFDAIESNYSKANIAHQLHKLALSDRNGTIYLHKKSNDGTGRVTHSEVLERKQSDLENLIEIEEIQTTTLDSRLAGKLDPLTYIVKLDVDGIEEAIIFGGANTISDASLIIIESSLNRRNVVSRIQLLESKGFRLWDICDPAYYYGQLSQVDLVFINERIRNKDVRFRPWEYSQGKVRWDHWQHELAEPEGNEFLNPFRQIQSKNTPSCNVCGSRQFTLGPGGRKSWGGTLPQCVECGSVERHRMLRSVWDHLSKSALSRTQALQFSRDLGVDESWFAELEISQYGGINSIDVQNIDRPDGCYDVVVCNHVLEHVADDKTAFRELMRIIKADGFLQMTVPKPTEIAKTEDWGFPDPQQHSHFRHYGPDLTSRFLETSPGLRVLSVFAEDIVTGAKGIVYFWSKSADTINQLQKQLKKHFHVIRE